MRPKHARTKGQKHEACKATKEVLHYTYQNQTCHDLSNEKQSYGMVKQDQKPTKMTSQ